MYPSGGQKMPLSEFGELKGLQGPVGRRHPPRSLREMVVDRAAEGEDQPSEKVFEIIGAASAGAGGLSDGRSPINLHDQIAALGWTVQDYERGTEAGEELVSPTRCPTCHFVTWSPNAPANGVKGACEYTTRLTPAN